MKKPFLESCKSLPEFCEDLNARYPKACNCSQFIRCDNRKYTSFDCAGGTFFDHQNSSCIAISDPKYAEYGCGGDTPWRRCQTVRGHQPLDVLREMCGSSNPGGEVGTTAPSGSNGGDNNGAGSSTGGGGGGGSRGVSGGAIAGGVVAAIIVMLVVAVAAYVVIKKRRGASARPRSRNYQIDHNGVQGASKDDDHEQVYDVIDDHAVSPAPSKFSVPPYTEVSKGKNVYTNSAFVENESNGGGYSLAKPLDQLAVPDDQRDDLSRTVSFDGREIEIEDAEGYQVAYPGGSMPRIPPADQSESDSQPPDTQQPDYFILEENEENHQE